MFLPVRFKCLSIPLIPYDSPKLLVLPFADIPNAIHESVILYESVYLYVCKLWWWCWWGFKGLISPLTFSAVQISSVLVHLESSSEGGVTSAKLGILWQHSSCVPIPLPKKMEEEEGGILKSSKVLGNLSDSILPLNQKGSHEYICWKRKPQCKTLQWGQLRLWFIYGITADQQGL